MLVAMPLVISQMASNARADETFNAGHFLDKMNTAEQYNYISGLVEGLAYARFLKDKPDETGMKCIHDWLYKDAKGSWMQIKQAFERFRKYPPPVVVHVLIKKKCGE